MLGSVRELHGAIRGRGVSDDACVTYRRAMEEKVASTVSVTWKTREGTPVPTTVILVPIAYEGELLALHFVTPDVTAPSTAVPQRRVASSSRRALGKSRSAMSPRIVGDFAEPDRVQRGRRRVA